jgi:hypothetical protein
MGGEFEGACSLEEVFLETIARHNMVTTWILCRTINSLGL